MSAVEQDELAHLLESATPPGALVVSARKGRSRASSGGLLMGRPTVARVRRGEHAAGRFALLGRAGLAIRLFWDGPLGYRGREHDRRRVFVAFMARTVIIVGFVGLLIRASVAIGPATIFVRVDPTPETLAAASTSARPPVDFLAANGLVGIDTLRYLDAWAATLVWRDTAAAVSATIGGDTTALAAAAARGALTPQLAAALQSRFATMTACPGPLEAARTCRLALTADVGDPFAPGGMAFFALTRHGGGERRGLPEPGVHPTGGGHGGAAGRATGFLAGRLGPGADGESYAQAGLLRGDRARGRADDHQGGDRRWVGCPPRWRNASAAYCA